MASPQHAGNFEAFQISRHKPTHYSVCRNVVIDKLACQNPDRCTLTEAGTRIKEIQIHLSLRWLYSFACLPRLPGV
jgi:hypothetical protein